MSNHRTHYQIERRMDRRAEATLNYVLSIAIGIGLACLLIAWWSS